MSKLDEIKKEFRTLLKEDLENAIQIIEESLDHNSKFYDDFVQFSSQINTLNRDNRIQTISRENYELRINKIIKGVLETVKKLTIEDLRRSEKVNNSSDVDFVRESDVSKFEMISYGEFKSKNGKYKLTIAPTVFFFYRLSSAFPGVRGLKWFRAETAIKRLKLLLREPTLFDIANGYGLFADPIWWFRGNSELPIERFRTLSHGKCLLNFKELKIAKIAAYNSSSYYRCFVYVEVEAEQPIGLYDYRKEQIEDVIEWRGYYDEEYGLYNDIPIRREEFDDGAAEINGDIVDTTGAELRIRFLTKYNFIIAAKTSPFNSPAGNKLGTEFMNGILKGEKTLEEFAEKAEELEKNWMDS